MCTLETMDVTGQMTACPTFFNAPIGKCINCVPRSQPRLK